VSTPPDLAGLLPHAGRMLLLDAVVRHDDAGTCCEAHPTADGWLADERGGAPAWLALEYMAQCVAAHESLCARAAGHSPGGGMLVGADGLELRTARLPGGRVLRVSTRRVKGRPGLGAVQHACRLEDTDGVELASGRLMVALEPGIARSAE